MRTSNYGVLETIQNVFYVIKSKILFKNARMIRFPIVIRGKKYIDFGTNLTTGRNCRIEVNGEHSGKRLIFGENVNIGDSVSIRCANSINIGNNVLMGSRVLVIDNSHGEYSGQNQDNPETPPNKRTLISKPIIIENNVWIGEQSLIMPGVTIGEGSIIGANSVVLGNVPRNCIAVGSPTKVIKRWDSVTEEWIKSE